MRTPRSISSTSNKRQQLLDEYIDVRSQMKRDTSIGDQLLPMLRENKRASFTSLQNKVFDTEVIFIRLKIHNFSAM